MVQRDVVNLVVGVLENRSLPLSRLAANDLRASVHSETSLGAQKSSLPHRVREKAVQISSRITLPSENATGEPPTSPCARLTLLKIALPSNLPSGAQRPSEGLIIRRRFAAPWQEGVQEGAVDIRYRTSCGWRRIRGMSRAGGFDGPGAQDPTHLGRHEEPHIASIGSTYLRAVVCWSYAQRGQ
jgi:hypothetical protein